MLGTQGTPQKKPKPVAAAKKSKPHKAAKAKPCTGAKVVATTGAGHAPPADVKLVNACPLKMANLTFAKKVRLAKLLKRPASATRPKFKRGGAPVAYGGGRVHWSAPHSKFRVYRRSVDKVEECISSVKGDTRDQALKFKCALAIIEEDPRPVK